MNEWWKAGLLGIMEGLTEFLPISSTGHLLVAAELLKFGQDAGGTFTIVIQFGAVLAVFSHYARDLFQQARSLPYDPAIQRLWLGIAIAVLPASVAGLLLYTWIKRVLFESPGVVAYALIVGGLVFIIVELQAPARAPTEHITGITLRQAFGIGIAQMCALVPGVSRSGATIIAGRLAGLDRPTATQFTFYLALPTLGGATLLDLAGSFGHLTQASLLTLLIGTALAWGAAWLSIGWLLGYVAHHTFMVFGVYRIAAGLGILFLMYIGYV